MIKKYDSQEEYIIKKDEDLFIYNLEFKGYVEKIWIVFNNDVQPPEKKLLTNIEQFIIFSKYLNDKGLAKIEIGSTKELLVEDSIEILNKNKNNFDFDLFLCLFREIYFYNLIKSLLSIFNIKEININTNLDPNQYSKILIVVLNKPNILLKNLNGDEKLEKNFYDACILFFKNFHQNYLENLLFPDLNKIKKDEEKNYLKKRSKIMINTILENPEKFSGLNNEIMKKLIDSMKDKKEKLKLINFTKKLEIKLFIINECLEEIKNKIEIDSNSLEYSFEDNIEKIMQYYSNILNYEQKLNIQGNLINIKEEIWNNYIEEYYKNNKIKYLYFLRKKLSKIGYSKNIFDILDKYIDKLGFDFIDKNMLQNKLLIEFLNNDFILYENQISKEKIDKITKCINFKLIKNNKDPFIQEFKNVDIKRIFKNNYEYFLQKMFSNILTMDSFYNIFKIYSPEEKIESEIIKEMYFRFNALLNLDPNINNSIYFNQIVSYLIEIFVRANNDKFNFKKLLDDINANNNLKKEKLSDLYNYLLLNKNYEKIVSDIICENVIKYSDDPYSIVTVIKNILNNINNENMNNSINNLKIILEKLSNKIINEEDFLSEKSEKFILFKLLVESDFFSEKFQYLNDTTYKKKTKIKIEEILKKYESCAFTISEACQLKEMKNLKDKIKILFFNKDFEAEYFYYTLKKNIYDAIYIKKLIDDVQNKNNIFFYKKEEDLKKIKDLSKKLSQIEIYKFKDYSNEINEYKTMAKEAEKANEYFKCEFFMNIFNTKKKDSNEREIIQESIKEFDKLIDLLDMKTIGNIQMSQLNIILSSKFNEDLIKKQFDFLKKYFHKNVDTTEIEKLINFYSKIILNILNSEKNIKKFLKLFNITITPEFSEDLNNSKKFFHFEKISDFIISTKFLNIKKLEENSNAFDILNKLIEKNDLTEFLIGKKEDDIKKFLQFVDSFLNTSDIQDLMKTVEFFNELKKINNEKDSIFMDKFYELCKNEKYKNMEDYIENVCKNFNLIKDLFNSNFNKKKLKK